MIKSGDNMRILILSNSGIGLYNFRFELIQKLSKEHEVGFCVPCHERNQKFEEIGCRFFECQIERHGTNPLKELKLLSFYRKILKEYSPDLVLTYTIKPNIYGGMACASLKIPYIANITGLGTAIQRGGRGSEILLRLYRYGLRKARMVFFQNRDNQKFMSERGIVKGEQDLLPGSGVNLEKHCFEEYPQTQDPITFLFAGRLMKDKGVTELFEAAKRIRQKYDHVHFVAVGNCQAEYREELEAIADSSTVQLAGFQPDVHSFMKQAHAIVHPSYHEGMSNVLLEGAACGRPILASNIPGCREAFEEGVSGIGFEPKNVDSLCQAIEKFIALPHEAKAEMGRAGRRKVEQEFDRGIVIAKYMDQIQKILEEK